MMPVAIAEFAIYPHPGQNSEAKQRDFLPASYVARPTGFIVRPI
jgi:hypothetical protein